MSEQTTPHRRALLSTAAWAVPSIAVTAAAPAMAASPSENDRITVEMRQAVGTRRRSTGLLRTEERLFLSTYGSADENRTNGSMTANPGTYIRWSGTSGGSNGTQVTDVKYVYYAPVSDLVFEAGASAYHSDCWTLLTRDTSLANVHHATSGVLLYPYSARYTCPIQSASPSITLQPFTWWSTGLYALATGNNRLWGRALYYTLNGVPGSVTFLAGNVGA